ncbi:MAG TPA: hypothetical protein VM422_01055 [Amaricoccus sp.]|nr:hypothetical protein [Amaricoccus sp.]
MSKTPLLAALVAIAAVGGSALAVEAATTKPPAPTVAPHPFSTAQRDQLAFEAGISPKQAEDLTIGQLAWLKARRDSDDGAYFAAPAQVNPAHVHS